MDIIHNNVIPKGNFRVYCCQLSHIPHICTNYAISGGQAPGEVAAMSKKLVHKKAANLAWWLEALIS